MKVPYQNYIGKEVFIFLLNDTIRSYSDLVLFDSQPGILRGALITFNKTTYIEITMDSFKHVKLFDPYRKWNKNLFYKEEIGQIKVYVNGECKLVIKKE
jgi:hypothetical protein